MKKRLLVLSLSLMSLTAVFAQRTVSGKVIDESNTPLIGASILVKGTSSGTVTDIDGAYSIDVPDGSNILVVSYTGYETQEIELGTSDIVDVTMASGVTQLEELVVIGYGETSTRFQTQTVSSVSAEQLQNRPLIGPQELLQGQAAGVQMVSNGGVVGANATVRIRGAASINAGGEPLYVVDGVPLNDGESADLSEWSRWSGIESR